MNDDALTLLDRIATALEYLSDVFSDYNAHLHHASYEQAIFAMPHDWEDVDLHDLYANLENTHPKWYRDVQYAIELEEVDQILLEERLRKSESPDEHLEHIDRNRNSDEDYFDAMTDGMLGEYDTFTDSGETSDWVSDWSGH